MMKELDFKEIANAKISSRIKQLVFLIVVILVGILISISTEAKDQTGKTRTEQTR